MFTRLFRRKKTAVSSSEEDLATRHRIDLELQYCPDCGDEYQAGFKQCASCGVHLISGKEKLAFLQKTESHRIIRAREISQVDTLVTIHSGKLRDLKALQRLLANDSLPAQIVGEAGGCGKG
jgi:hypothetical protein